MNEVPSGNAPLIRHDGLSTTPSRAADGGTPEGGDHGALAQRPPRALLEVMPESRNRQQVPADIAERGAACAPLDAGTRTTTDPAAEFTTEGAASFPPRETTAPTAERRPEPPPRGTDPGTIDSPSASPTAEDPSPLPAGGAWQLRLASLQADNAQVRGLLTPGPPATPLEELFNDPPKQS